MSLSTRCLSGLYACTEQDFANLLCLFVQVAHACLQMAGTTAHCKYAGGLLSYFGVLSAEATNEGAIMDVQYAGAAAPVRVK